ncbi:MAG TPA: DUF87 domain-containing protein [Myxococcota bacterium]|nr:DUF87 domain-containing protein [Myxococcota bacterium]
MKSSDYEKLGVFYLGREFDLASGHAGEAPLLYDSKDLTTHAVVVGMTGSGKTGLAITLLEEAAIDGIPVVAIDPKGDLPNLLLTFPQLRPEDFRPWVDAAGAARAGHTPDEEAKSLADRWRDGLAATGQDGARIARFADAAERIVWTPGSRAGRPLSVLRSFAAPPPALREDDEALRERAQGAVSGLLALVGVEADPLRSREHILLTTLLCGAWREGRDMDLGALIQAIQKPGLERVGVLDLETFFPARDRAALATSLNNLLAAPGFAVWSEGPPLDAPTLLFAEGGKPRLSIVSIAHLSDAERMFVVTLLLEQLIAWMRAQPGASTLRALLYMDEVFGYFPPVASPPSKAPMLTLLKQARAYGLGVVLATQNPVDLDYKGLSNAGTWFLGRLQTERDKARVLEGLEGASTAAGASFDRARMDATLAGLRSRVFLMNNVHEDAPVVFETRQSLSFLAGPLTREQIRALPGEGGAAAKDAPAKDAAPATAAAPAPAASAAASPRPVVPAEVREGFLPATQAASGGITYRPALLGVARLHYVDAKAGVDQWTRTLALAPLGESSEGEPWESATLRSAAPPKLESAPLAGARFAALPADAARAASYARWQKQLASHLLRSAPLELFACASPAAVSRPGEGEAEFRARIAESGRAARDQAVARLRERYAPQLARLQQRIAAAEQRSAVEREQFQEKTVQSAISIGATLVGALFGRKLASRGNMGRITTAARGVSRAAREHGDIARADEKAEDLRAELAALEAQLSQDVGAKGAQDGAQAEVTLLPIPPRKSDLEIESVSLVWLPHAADASGREVPLYSV